MTATTKNFWVLTILGVLASCISNAQAQQHLANVEMTPLNPEFAIQSVESSGDGRYSLVTSFKEARVLDNKTGAEIIAFVRSPQQNMFKIGSIDGRCVLAALEKGSKSYSLVVYDPRTDREIIRRQIPRFTEEYGMVISGDGRRLMLINHNITIFDTLTLKQIATVKSPMQGSGNNFFVPGSSRVLMAGTEKRRWILKLWDYQTGEFVYWKKQDEPIYSIAVSPNGKTAAVSYRNRVQILDLSLGQNFRVRTTIQMHLAGPSIGFSENGRFLWAVKNEALQGWEMESGKRIVNERFKFKCFCVLGNNSRLQFVAEDDRLALKQMDLKPAICQSLPALWSHRLGIEKESKIHVPNDGKLIYWNAQHKQIRHADLKTGKSLGEFPLPTATQNERDQLLSGGLYRISPERLQRYDFQSNQFVSLFSPNDQWKIATVTEIENRGLMIRCESNASTVQFLAQREHSAPRNYLASSDLTIVKRLPNFHAFDKVCFSPTMRYVALWTPKRTRVWDLERQLEMGECSFEKVTGFRGNQLLGKQRKDQFLYDWKNDTTSRFTSFLLGGEAKMLDNGLALASASDGVLRVWDISGNSAIGTLDLEHPAEVSDIQISPTNRYLVVQFADGHVGVWDLKG